MIHKNTLLQGLATMPDNIDCEELIEKIILLDKIERAADEINSGKGLSAAEVKIQLAKWLN